MLAFAILVHHFPKGIAFLYHDMPFSVYHEILYHDISCITISMASLVRTLIKDTKKHKINNLTF